MKILYMLGLFLVLMMALVHCQVTYISSFSILQKFQSGGSDYANFGSCISVNGNYTLIGEKTYHPVYSTRFTGGLGRAYIYRRTPVFSSGTNNTSVTTASWTLLKVISSPYLASPMFFGSSCVLSAPTNDVTGQLYAIISAPGYTSGGSGAMRGSVFVFGQNAGGVDNWGWTQEIMATDATDSMNRFGESLAVGNNILAIGAPFKNLQMGEGYIYNLVGGNYTLVKIFNGTRLFAGSGFSAAVSSNDDYIAFGMPGFFSQTGGVSVLQVNFGGANNWGEIYVLQPSDTLIGDGFGHSVAFTKNNELFVGALRQDYKSASSGSVYYYMLVNTTMTLIKKLGPTPSAGGEFFGSSLGIDQTDPNQQFLFVGAPETYGSSGACFLFLKSQGGQSVWGQYAAIGSVGNSTATGTIPYAAIGDRFGATVAVSGNIMYASALNVAYNSSMYAAGSLYTFAFTTIGIFSGNPPPPPAPSTNSGLLNNPSTRLLPFDFF
jgi:hypothetical protein